MKFYFTLLSCLVVFTFCLVECSQGVERPNVLWLTSEDNSFQWLGCYGSKDASTPHLDELASRSTLYTKAYSNAAVCAVARSTLLTGAYAPSIGTQHMRSRYPIPSKMKPYVNYLQEAGYYCTNNSKTDYNFVGNDKSYWDECSGKAHYKNRPDGKPFFAIFNIGVSHESSLFPKVIKKNRKYGTIPKETRLDQATLDLPPYVPDLPEMRSDWAIYHDNVTAMDREVGKFLDELEAAGLADDTIIFYYSDHGGATPRGKRYLSETGVRVPLIIHCPEKWKHLSPFKSGEKTNEMVAFVDFAPTLLSLCGIEKPKQMMGRPFLGAQRVEPNQEQEVYLFADRFDEIIGMRRGYTDGRYKYIRRFMPQLPAAPYSYYQFGQPAWNAWQEAWKGGELSGRHKEIWEVDQPVEALFDLEADPWEVNNLVDEHAYANQLVKMRNRLKAMMVELKDTSLVPEPILAQSGKSSTVYDFVRSNQLDLKRTADIAFLASERNVANRPQLIEALQDKHPIIRYWGAIGCQILGSKADANRELFPLLDDKDPSVRITTATALAMSGDSSARDRAIKQLITELDNDINDQAILLLINTAKSLGISDQIPNEWVRKTLEKKNANDYVKRYAKMIKASRN